MLVFPDPSAILTSIIKIYCVTPPTTLHLSPASILFLAPFCPPPSADRLLSPIVRHGRYQPGDSDADEWAASSFFYAPPPPQEFFTAGGMSNDKTAVISARPQGNQADVGAGSTDGTAATATITRSKVAGIQPQDRLEATKKGVSIRGSPEAFLGEGDGNREWVQDFDGWGPEAVKVAVFGDMGTAEADDSLDAGHDEELPSMRTVKILRDQLGVTGVRQQKGRGGFGIGGAGGVSGSNVGPELGLVLHIGDLSYARGYDAQWDEVRIEIDFCFHRAFFQQLFIPLSS